MIIEADHSPEGGDNVPAAMNPVLFRDEGRLPERLSNPLVRAVRQDACQIIARPTDQPSRSPSVTAILPFEVAQGVSAKLRDETVCESPCVKERTERATSRSRVNLEVNFTTSRPDHLSLLIRHRDLSVTSLPPGFGGDSACVSAESPTDDRRHCLHVS